jgi:hypothetical protein
VRSLAEDEEHLFTFYAFPQTMHRHIQSTNAIESLFSNVRQRTDQIDVLYFGDQLPGDCLGHDPGHPLAQNLAVSAAPRSLEVAPLTTGVALHGPGA